MPPATGYVDGIFATGTKRNLGGPGNIAIEVLSGSFVQTHTVNGVVVPLKAELTPLSFARATRVRQELPRNGLLLNNKNLLVRVTADASLTVAEQLRVDVHFAHI